MTSSSKIFFVTVLLTFFLVKISTAQDQSFLKKGYYNRSIWIENPEKSPLAEAFLRNGIRVLSPSSSVLTSCFSFKTSDEENKFVVFIYYDGDFVGKYNYFKKNTSEDITEFIDSFVRWMFRNAWGK